MTAAAGMVHIAGNDVQVGPYLRQRCSWCGVVLIDHDLSAIMYESRTPPDQRRPATWPVGALVEVDGHVSSIVEHEDGAELPANACGQLDPAVTA